jgi:exonuclease V gamma subunit
MAPVSRHTWLFSFTRIVTESSSEPSSLVQVILNVVVLYNAPVRKEPERFLLPDHPFVPFVPRQVSASSESQRTIVLSPLDISVSSALISTVGSFELSSSTLIVTESTAEPELLLQVMLYTLVLVKLPVLKEPERFLLPDHPFVPPDAVHEVAF